jgi:hypothetical protein
MSGEIVLTFHNAHLFNINFKLAAALSQEQTLFIKKHLPFTEDALLQHKFGGAFDIAALTEVPAMDKVALFMKEYREYLSIDYQKQKRDHLMIASFDVTEALLKTYFTSDNILFKEKHSIGNFCKFYNQLRAEHAGAYKQKRFPDHYDTNFIKTLKTIQELHDYYAHLRSKGLVAKKNSTGQQIIDFVKPDNAQS